MPLTKAEYRALRWAISQAEDWRGTLIGNPDPQPLEHFDAYIAFAKRALKKISPYKKGGKHK